jgi:putative membrane protein
MSTAMVMAVLVVLVLHVWFAVLEMVLWKRPLGRRVFGLDAAFAERSAALAANQGLYNGFLVAGLAWGLWEWPTTQGRALLLFFLGCVVVAGVFGAATVSRRILWLQALPAAVALVLVLLAGH